MCVTFILSSALECEIARQISSPAAASRTADRDDRADRHADGKTGHGADQHDGTPVAVRRAMVGGLCDPGTRGKAKDCAERDGMPRRSVSMHGRLGCGRGTGGAGQLDRLSLD
jgi:hypothetical protein